MNDSPQIDVLIVDDSPTARELLSFLFSQEPGMRVVGVAKSGDEALRLVKEKKPSIVTMDLHMPGMNGLQATRAIMQESPLPVVIVSATATPADAVASLEAIDAGALAFVTRPSGPGAPDYESSVQDLVKMVRLMAEVPVVSRGRMTRVAPSTPITQTPSPGRLRVVGIAGSTGAPVPLRTIIESLPTQMSFSVVVVQHLSNGFLEGLAEWLRKTSQVPIEIARDGKQLEPGKVYLAPDSHQLGVDSSCFVRLSSTAPPEYGSKPSAAYLFRSLAENLRGLAAGVILSGMGSDGGLELKLLRDAGGTTIAQSKESSIIFGMPGVAVACGAAVHVLSPEEIAGFISRWAILGGK